MKRTYLIQRLHKPHTPTGTALDALDGLAFGGGLVNGGLSKDAMAAIRTLFSFDYMGASEFEWGTVPKALAAIAERRAGFCRTTVEIDLSTIPPEWVRGKQRTTTGKRTVFVLCHKDEAEQVRQIIRDDAAGKIRLKEWTSLGRALLPPGEYPDRTCGWLELDNGFMFFTDEDMFKRVADAFGVTDAV